MHILQLHRTSAKHVFPSTVENMYTGRSTGPSQNLLMTEKSLDTTAQLSI